MRTVTSAGNGQMYRTREWHRWRRAPWRVALRIARGVAFWSIVGPLVFLTAPFLNDQGLRFGLHATLLFWGLVGSAAALIYLVVAVNAVISSVSVHPWGYEHRMLGGRFRVRWEDCRRASVQWFGRHAVFELTDQKSRTHSLDSRDWMRGRVLAKTTALALATFGVAAVQPEARAERGRFWRLRNSVQKVAGALVVLWVGLIIVGSLTEFTLPVWFGYPYAVTLALAAGVAAGISHQGTAPLPKIREALLAGFWGFMFGMSTGILSLRDNFTPVLMLAAATTVIALGAAAVTIELKDPWQEQ